MAIDIRARMAEAIAAQNENPATAGLMELDAATQRTADNWADPVRAGVSYYRVPDRRMPRGRITLLQNGNNAMEMIEHRGYQSLRPKYGGYKSANQIGDWQRSDPYLGIVQRGGLHEFDAQQIHDLKWHHTPTQDATTTHLVVAQHIQSRVNAGATRDEAILAVLPQLAGWDIAEYPCALCPGRIGGPFATLANLEAHRSVQHRENVQTEGTRDAVAAALQTSGGDMSKLIEALTAVAAGLAAQQVANAAIPEQPKRGPGRPPKSAAETDTETE